MSLAPYATWIAHRHPPTAYHETVKGAYQSLVKHLTKWRKEGRGDDFISMELHIFDPRTYRYSILFKVKPGMTVEEVASQIQDLTSKHP